MVGRATGWPGLIAQLADYARAGWGSECRRAAPRCLCLPGLVVVLAALRSLSLRARQAVPARRSPANLRSPRARDRGVGRTGRHRVVFALHARGVVRRRRAGTGAGPGWSTDDARPGCPTPAPAAAATGHTAPA
jgi:hypothetical protein